MSNYQDENFSTVRDNNRRRVVSFSTQLDLIYSILNQIQRNAGRVRDACYYREIICVSLPIYNRIISKRGIRLT